MTKEQKINFIVNVGFYTILLAIGFYVFKFVLSYLFPVIIGLFITVFLQKPARIISNKAGISKSLCSVFLVLVTYITIMGLIVFGIYKAGTYLGTLTSDSSESLSYISQYIKDAKISVENFIQKLSPTLSNIVTSFIEKFSTMITSYLSEFVKNTAFSTPMFITGSVVTIIASCYIAKDYDRFKISIKSVLKDRYIIAFYKLREIFCNKFFKLITGYLKLLVITFLELAVGLILLKAKNAIIIAALIALLDLLPVFGTGTVLIPWGIINIVSGDIYKGVGLIILYVIVALIRNIIEPKIIGKQIGLHPLIALVAVFIGLKLFGFFGIFSVPFTIILVYNMFEEGIFDLLFNKNQTSTVQKNDL